MKLATLKSSLRSFRRWPLSSPLFATEGAQTLTDSAQERARQLIRKPTLAEMLQRWWAKKYQLPSNHSLFQEQTLEDLLTEFWADVYEANPIEVHRQEDGHIQLKNTGDPYVDKWEEEIAQGITPDFTEMFTPEQMAKYRRLRVKAAGGVPRRRELQEAVDAHNANHPVERSIRARQGALDRSSNPARFGGTFGDD